MIGLGAYIIMSHLHGLLVLDHHFIIIGIGGIPATTLWWVVVSHDSPWMHAHLILAWCAHLWVCEVSGVIYVPLTFAYIRLFRRCIYKQGVIIFIHVVLMDSHCRDGDWDYVSLGGLGTYAVEGFDIVQTLFDYGVLNIKWGGFGAKIRYFLSMVVFCRLNLRVGKWFTRFKVVT